MSSEYVRKEGKPKVRILWFPLYSRDVGDLTFQSPSFTVQHFDVLKESFYVQNGNGQ